MGREKSMGRAYNSSTPGLMTRRITIKLRLTGKSRLISNSTSSSAEVVTELYEILELSLS